MRVSKLAVLALSLAACGGDGKTPVTPVPQTPATISVQTGDAQTVPSGDVAPIAPAVLVRDAQGRPVAGAVVTFVVSEGGGTLDGATPTTDGSGVASVTRWRMGSAGPQRLTATAGSAVPVSIVATILPGTQALTTVIPATGGAVEITDVGHPYRGLRLTLPPGTFPGAATWGMRVVPNAVPPVMPAGYRVAGPALEIASTQLRGTKLMTLNVPLRRAASSDVVLVFFDPDRRVLEVLPTVARTDTSIMVATTHLRSELLVGRSGPASKEAAAFRVASREPPPGLLFPVEFPVPMPVVPPVANQEKFRWSVDDYGTPAFPGGFGLEISSLRFVTAQTAPGSFALTDVVKGMQTPGFYLDAAPIAILSRMAGARTEAVSQLKQLSDFRLGDKATRDNYTFSNIAAQLALTGQPSMAAVYGESGVFGAEDRTAYTLVVGSPTNTLTLSSAVSSTTLAFPRAESGFQPTTVPGVAGAPGISVDAVLPVSSFVFSFRPSEVGLGDLLTLEGKTGAARQSINTSLAASAGLPAPKLEFEAVPGGGWMPFDAANTVLRTKSARVRVAAFPGFGGSGSTTVVNSGSDGTELGRANSNIIDFGGIPAVSALAELRPTEFVFTPGSAGFGSLVRPFIPVTETVTRATFVLTSDTSRVAEGFRLGVEAKVPLPPSGGFRIRFEWGDGTMTETVNQTTTSHIYGAEGSFGVVSTLTTGDAARATLAFDTVRVSNGAEAGWIISTVTDQDSLFKDGDPSDDSPTVALLKRMLAAPRSALISVDSTSPSPTKTLRLRVLPSSLWQPGTCCASIRPGEMRQTLGVDPLRRYVVGPYFAGWDTDTWAQSTTNLNTGTMTGQSLLNLAQFNVEGGGTQTGPAGGFRFNAARNGTAMTGTILLWIWEFDAEEGSPMYVNKAPTLYRFPFTATRVR